MGVGTKNRTTLPADSLARPPHPSARLGAEAVNEERKRSAWPGVVGGVVALVLYIASFGPAYAIVIHNRVSELPRWFEVTYAPFLWACRHSDTLPEMMDDYGGWCYRTMFPILWK